MSFANNKFQVIKQAIPYELANFCFNYFLLKRDAVKFIIGKTHGCIPACKKLNDIDILISLDWLVSTQ